MTAHSITRVGLVGWPVEHSLSPTMFNALFEALDMPWNYETFAVEPADLAGMVSLLHEQGVRGFNVTVPHKRSIISLLDNIRPEARVIGAVNTVIPMDGDTARWQGTNTDIIGFHQDISSLMEPPEQGSYALILGAGGAARAAAYVLARTGYRLFIVSRDPARGLELIRDIQSGLAASGAGEADSFGSTQWRMQMRTIPWERLGQIKADIRLVVNCTPVGLWPDVNSSPWPEEVPLPPLATVYDMVYRPQETRLMQQARAAGLPAFNGLGMLVQQGAAAFELWTGKPARTDIMLAAAQRVLNHD